MAQEMEVAAAERVGWHKVEMPQHQASKPFMLQSRLPGSAHPLFKLLPSLAREMDQLKGQKAAEGSKCR